MKKAASGIDIVPGTLQQSMGVSVEENDEIVWTPEHLRVLQIRYQNRRQRRVHGS